MSRAFLLSMATVLGAMGCNGIVGTPDSVGDLALDAGDDQVVASGDDAGGLGDAPSCFADGDQNNLCYSCDDQYCCSEQAACFASSYCLEYESCMKACTAPGADGGYDSCTVECDGKNPTGHVLYAPHFACVEKNCLAPCGGDTSDPCTACLYSSCPNDFYDCQSDAACDTMLACIGLCNVGDSACVSRCQANGSAATREAANAVLSCGVTFCSNVCATPP